MKIFQISSSLKKPPNLIVIGQQFGTVTEYNGAKDEFSIPNWLVWIEQLYALSQRKQFVRNWQEATPMTLVGLCKVYRDIHFRCVHSSSVRPSDMRKLCKRDFIIWLISFIGLGATYGCCFLFSLQIFNTLQVST
jgi:hypothetical protein